MIIFSQQLAQSGNSTRGIVKLIVGSAVNSMEGITSYYTSQEIIPNIHDIPQELFVEHIFPELTYEAFASSRLVSKHWKNLTDKCQNSLIQRVIKKGETLNPSQWRIVAHESKEFLKLVNSLYTILQQFNFVFFKEEAQVESDVRVIESIAKEIAKGMDLIKIDEKLLDAFFDSINLCMNNKIFSKEDWRDKFFDIIFEDVIGKCGFLYQFAQTEIEWRLQWLENENDIVAYLEKGANDGSEDDQMLLGYLYRFGREDLGISEDPERALFYYKLAARKGHPVAQFYLGCSYATGEFVEQDWKKAILYFYRVARRYNPPFFISAATCMLAYCYAKGKELNVNMQKAQEYMIFAGNQGSSIAKLYLGFCYASGVGVEQNWKEAIRKFIPLALAFDNPWAGIAMAKCYMRGKGVEQSWLRASQHFVEAYDNWRKHIEQ